MLSRSKVRVVLPSRYARVVFKLPTGSMNRLARTATEINLEELDSVHQATCATSGEVTLLLKPGVNSKLQITALINKILSERGTAISGKIEFEGGD